MVIIKVRNQNHNSYAQNRKHRLTRNKIVTVAILIIIGIGITGRKQHDKADGQQNKHQKKQGQIHTGTDRKKLQLFSDPPNRSVFLSRCLLRRLNLMGTALLLGRVTPSPTGRPGRGTWGRMPGTRPSRRSRTAHTRIGPCGLTPGR